MSLLETFFIKFEADGLKEISAELEKISPKAEKTCEQVAEKTEEVSKETENLEKKAKKAGNSYVETGNKIIKALAPIVGLAALFNRTMNFASSAEEMSYLAQNTGLAVEKFQALALAAENYGGSAEGIAGSLQGLNANLQNMRFGKGGGGVEEAALTYGINLYGKNGLATADELLMNVAKRFESLNSVQQVDLGQRLGLDEGTIRLLQTGVANVQKELERGQKYSLFNKEDVENSRKFQRTLRDIKLGFAQIFGILARALLPAFTWIAEGIKSFFDTIKDHSGFVISFLTTVGVLLGVLAIKSALAFAPFLIGIALITAAATTIGLLIDDIVNFWQGNESLIGAFVDAVKVVFSALWNFLKDGFSKVVDWFKDLSIVKMAGKLFGEGEQSVDMADAQRKLAMTQTPLSAIPQGSIANNYTNNSQSMRVDQVIVNTQATDGYGVAGSISNGLQTAMQGMATSRV